jgi:hypothetical protein
MTEALHAVPMRPRVTHARVVPDLAAAEAAAVDFLTALGIPLDDPDLSDTPGRLARAYAELLDVPEYDFTTFRNTERYDELVLVQDIPVRSGASTTCCRSPASRTSATCRRRGSSASPSSRARSSTSRAVRRPRSG